MTEQALNSSLDQDAKSPSQRSNAHLVYILQAVGFLIGITFIAGVIVNYVKKNELTDPVVISHFRWQIRTFWFSALWTIIGSVLAVVVVGYFVVLANVIWTIYRVVRGWLRLNDGLAMYENKAK